MLAASVSVSSCAPCLVGLEGLVLQVSSIPSGSHNPFTSSSSGFPELQGEGPDGDLPCTLFLPCRLFLSGCGFLHLLPSAAEGASGNDWMLIYEYSKISLVVILLILFVFQTGSVWFYSRSLGSSLSGSWSPKQCQV